MLLLKQIIVSVVVIVFSAWYYWLSGFLPEASADPLGPAALPRLIAVSMIVFGLAHIVVSYFRRNRLADDEEPDPLSGSAKVLGNLRIVAVIVLTGIYLLAMVPLGYAVSTFGYVLLLMILLGARSPQGLTIASVGLTVSLVLLFAKFLGVLVPEGFVEQLILH